MTWGASASPWGLLASSSELTRIALRTKKRFISWVRQGGSTGTPNAQEN